MSEIATDLVLTALHAAGIYRSNKRGEMHLLFNKGGDWAMQRLR